jgi:hypothetical protein
MDKMFMSQYPPIAEKKQRRNTTVYHHRSWQMPHRQRIHNIYHSFAAANVISERPLLVGVFGADIFLGGARITKQQYTCGSI